MKKFPVFSVIALATTLFITGCPSTGGTGVPIPVLHIATEPANASVALGLTATFTVVAGGPAPFSYQWSRGGTAISGATSADFTTAPTTAADNGAVFVVTVSDAGSSVTSLPATLTVGGTSAMPLVKAQYAFSYSGQNAAGPISIVGSFTADGNGSITAGIEDISSVKTGSATVASQASITMTGTYTVGNDGRGMMKLSTSGDGPQNFAFVIEAGNRGQLTWSDATASGSGAFDLQDPAALAAVAPNGRGTMELAFPSFNPVDPEYVFYIASDNIIYLMETDTTQVSSGQAMAQTGGPYTTASLVGTYGIQFAGGQLSSEVAASGQLVACNS